MQLGDNLRRGLETTLGILDEILCEFEEWARGREHRSVLYSEHNSLSPSDRDALLSEIAEMRSVLQEFRDDLALEGRMREAAHSIWGSCAVLLTNLEELTGKHLARYGDIPRQLPEYLEPRIRRLMSSLQHIFRLAAKPKK